MEHVLRSLKTEWIPNVGYITAQEANRDISHYLMIGTTGLDRISSIMSWPRLRPRKN
jgi:hypothetical protein